jgi:hypothetical protein
MYTVSFTVKVSGRPLRSLRVFENRVTRIAIGHKREEVEGG